MMKIKFKQDTYVLQRTDLNYGITKVKQNDDFFVWNIPYSSLDGYTDFIVGYVDNGKTIFCLFANVHESLYEKIPYTPEECTITTSFSLKD